MNRVNLTQSNYNTFGTTPTILVVNTDVTIGTGSVSFADGCVFEFAGGIIKSGGSSNGTITGSVSVVSNYGLVQLFDHINVPDLVNRDVPIEWFGGKCYANSPGSSPTLSDQAIANAVLAHRDRKIMFQPGYYVFSQSVTISRSGITLSGTKSCSMQWNGFRQSATDGRNSVSALKYTGSSNTSLFNITCDGIRMENLLLLGSNTHTAVILSGNCVNVFADRCMFHGWKKGIYKSGTSSGLSRCIIDNCVFNYIKETAIEANVGYVTCNMIRDSWFHYCGNPIRLVSTSQLLQDNSIDNCNFDFVIYDSTLYSTYGCCAIYLESQTANRNYATNNISRCYFERICYDPDTNPPSWATNTAAVICKDTSITIDNNFFTSTPRYFIIDSCSSISIGDNGIGINYSEASTYPLQHDTLVYVIPSSVNKSIRQSILYSNSIPISTDSGCSFITKLVSFAQGAGTNFSVRNLYETRFTDYAHLL